MIDTPFLTTIDNPHNPFEDFQSWWVFDNTHGYNCSGIAATIAPPSDKLSPEENDQLKDKAFDHFVANDFLGIYIKVTPATAPEVARRASLGDYYNIIDARHEENESD